MTRWLLALVCVVVACTDDESNLVIEISSELAPLDSVGISVFGDRGAIVLDQQIGDRSPISLPRRVRIEGGAREEGVRVLAWGLQTGTRVAFGYTTGQLVRGREDTLSIVLATPPADCDHDAVPDMLDRCPSITDPAQDDADGDGMSDACTPGAACPANLFTTGDFEIGTGGWVASNVDPATLARVPGGHGGEYAAELCKVPNGALNDYTMDDRPNTVMAPTPNGRYRFDAWVRSDSPVAQTIEIRIGEVAISTETPIAATIVGVPATPAWQLLTTTYTITAAAGTSALDSRLRVRAAPDGACFFADDLCLQELVAGCP